MAAFLNPGAYGEPFTEALDLYANMAGMWLGGEDMDAERSGHSLHGEEPEAFARELKSFLAERG